MFSIKKFLFTLFLLLSLLLGASPLPAEAVGADFSVSPILPDNQVDDASYFNLLVEPDTTQSISLAFENFSDHSKEIHITPTTAKTTTTGNFDYTTRKGQIISGSILSDLISPPQTVRLGPQSKKTVSFTLKTPKESFEGALVGAFRIIEVNEDTAQTLNNQFAYEIGLVIRERKKLPLPNVQIEQLKYEKGTLKAILTNHSGGYLSQEKLSGTLSGEQELTFTDMKLSMAPNSQATIELPFNNFIKPGEYELKLVINKQHNVTQKFKISANNQIDTYVDTLNPIFLLTLLIIIGLSASCIFIIYIYIKQ